MIGSSVDLYSSDQHFFISDIRGQFLPIGFVSPMPMLNC